LILELHAARDDDHLLAIYRARGGFGAVAKSNFVTLRFREPVYRSLRELAMSYFDGYFNVDGERSLRSYSATLDLSRFDRLHWETDDSVLDGVLDRLDALRHYPVASPRAIAAFEKVDERSYRAGMLGSRPEGLFVPKGSSWRPG
jgi:hypothetical protein